MLAYFKPEGDEDSALQGTDLKERFYAYLKAHHGSESQIIVVENQYPPDSELDGLNVEVFTRNLAEGRYGFLEPAGTPILFIMHMSSALSRHSIASA